MWFVFENRTSMTVSFRDIYDTDGPEAEAALWCPGLRVGHHR